MKFIETLKLAVSAIWAHKLRSALTLLGMIIGVAAVVVVVSLIQGFNTYVDEKIAGIGAKSYTINRFSMDDWKDTDSIAAAQRRNKELNLADFEFLKPRLSLTDKFGAAARPQRSQIKRGSEILEEVPVDGKSPVVGEIQRVDVADGRFFTQVDEDNASRVAFIGADVATKLFPRSSPVGEEIVVTARNDEQFDEAVEEARHWMRIRRGLEKDEKDSFGVMTPDAITGLRDRLFGTIFWVAIAVPGIALVVGG